MRYYTLQYRAGIYCSAKELIRTLPLRGMCIHHVNLLRLVSWARNSLLLLASIYSQDLFLMRMKLYA